MRAGAGAHFHTTIVQGVKWEEVGILKYQKWEEVGILKYQDNATFIKTDIISPPLTICGCPNSQGKYPI